MFDRAGRVLAFLWVGLVTVGAANSGDAVPKGPAVEAGGETLIGVQLDGGTGLAVFRGIPYAAPPIGPLRWRPPESPTPRDGPQDATHFGPACPQLQGNPDWYRDVAEGFGRSRDVVPDLTHIRENCLYLNIWSQNLRGNAPQPVLVWIHGGSNKNGFSNEPNYLGHNLARREVVVVSIGYRLGALGFMAHPALTAESERNVSGNYGILDQIAALQWIRANIAAFGGDPQQITVFGESAGGGDIGTLITSPLGKDLFRRAVIQSGGYPLNSTQTLGDEEALGIELMGALGVGESEQLPKMRALPWNEIVSAVPETLPDHYYDAIIDGWLLPRSAAELIEAGEQNSVDLLIGSNANESLMYLPETTGEKQLQEAIDARVLEEDRKATLSVLEVLAPGNVEAKLDRLIGSSYFHCPSKAFARAMRRKTERIYVYRFSRVRPNGESLLAYHGAEIPYVFDTADEWLPADSIDRALTDTMLGYWIQFAKTGDPNGSGLPNWPAFDLNTEDYQDLGDEVRSAQGLERDLCRILDRAKSR